MAEQFDDKPNDEPSDSDTGDESYENAEWVAIGFVADKVTADFVIESLRSYEIPAVLNSKSGFFGASGMSGLEMPFSGGTGAYEILTVAEKIEEAKDIAGMVAGDKWEPAGPKE